MKDADCILCTVFLWIASVLPLILAVEGVSFIVHIKRQVVEDVTSSDDAVRILAQLSNGGPTHTQAVLGISVAVCLFSLIGLRVVWPRVFKGELLLQHDIDCLINERRMTITWQAMGAILSSSLTW